MKHFLTKLLDNTPDLSTHRRFIKFSKGDYPNGGPVIAVKATKNNKLSINASFEYEDLLGYFVASHLPEGQFKVEGSIYTQPRVELEYIEEQLAVTNLNSGWESGKRDLKNLYVLNMHLSLSRTELVQIYDSLADYCFLLLSITPEKGKDWAFKSDSKIPPLKKTYGKAEPYDACKPDKREKCSSADFCNQTGICISDRTKFCRVKTSALSREELTDFLTIFLPDFKQLHQTSFSDLVIINQYTITDFIMPDNRDKLDAKELREKIKKVGFVERIVYMDAKVHSNKMNFTV